MTAFLFSGQGSQYTGMGKELLEANPEFSFIYDKASEILGYDLKKVTFEGTEEELAQTCNSQPAIMAMSLLCFETAKKNGISMVYQELSLIPTLTVVQNLFLNDEPHKGMSIDENSELSKQELPQWTRQDVKHRVLCTQS